MQISARHRGSLRGLHESNFDRMMFYGMGEWGLVVSHDVPKREDRGRGFDRIGSGSWFDRHGALTPQQRGQVLWGSHRVRNTYFSGVGAAQVNGRSEAVGAS